YDCGLLTLGTQVFALPAAPLIRRRGWVIVAWTALALLFGPRACHVQQVLALRGSGSETTESSRATELLKKVFPTPFADYVAIVVHGPVRWTNVRLEAVLDTLKAAVERRPYVGQVISARTIGESSFVSQDRHTTFLIAALTPMSVFVLNITTMVGLGVGIDYSLLIVTRFREELNRGLSSADAAIRTVETAGSAVVTSGLTVVVGFAALVTTPLSDTRSVGVG